MHLHMKWHINRNACHAYSCSLDTTFLTHIQFHRGLTLHVGIPHSTSAAGTCPVSLSRMLREWQHIVLASGLSFWTHFSLLHSLIWQLWEFPRDVPCIVDCPPPGGENKQIYKSLCHKIQADLSLCGFWYCEFPFCVSCRVTCHSIWQKACHKAKTKLLLRENYKHPVIHLDGPAHLLGKDGLYSICVPI